ncbi:hypothetical protein D0Z03_002270 [Geotrichum reessii]|nr:hypothetical protein D0Z03_002270 [Galactomyces reessii]
MQAEELDESDESVIVLEEVSVSQRSKEKEENDDDDADDDEDDADDDESMSDQSERNYTLNETAKPNASNLAIPPNEQDIRSVANVSEDQIGENSTGNASVQAKDKFEQLSYNINESFQNELGNSSDSDAAGNHSLFFIDQLNEVESTQIEDSDDAESSKAEDDEVNLGSPTASNNIDQSELEEVVLSRLEQEVLDEEVKNLAEEVPELNAEELIDQGTPVSPNKDDPDAQNTDIKTNYDELKDNNKNFFLQDDSDSTFEKVKENISTYLMDNPTSDDYLYEARMQDAAATSVYEQLIQRTVTVEHAEVLGNTAITEDVAENFRQSQTDIFTSAASHNSQAVDDPGDKEDEIQTQIFAIQKTTENLESNFAVVTEKVHTPSSHEETEIAAEHTNSAVEAETDDPVQQVKLNQEKSESPSNFKSELELAKYINDQPEPASIDKAKLEQDDLEEKSLKIEDIDDNEEQDSFKVKVEPKFAHDELSTFDNQQQDAMDIDQDEDGFNGETLEPDLQKDIKMEDIAENENDPQPNTTNKNEEIEAFLEKLAKTSDNEDDIKDDIKQDEDEQNEYKVKSNIDSDVDKSESDNDDGKDEKPWSADSDGYRYCGDDYTIVVRIRNEYRNSQLYDEC